MEDLTTRLLKLPEPQCSPCREAAAEIEMLRQQWREMSSAMMELRRENARLRITPEEREAIAGAIEAEHGRGAWQWADALRSLLERTA